MVHAAVLSTEQVISSGLRSFKPEGRVTSGDDVGFRAKRRYEEVMNHVFRRHDQLDFATNRHVQLVDLTLAGGVLQFPHPLLADDVNLNRILGRFVLIEIDACAPAKHRHRDDEGNNGPERFELMRARDRTRDLVRRAPPVTNDKEDQY